MTEARPVASCIDRDPGNPLAAAMGRSLGPTIWRMVESFAMSPALLFLFSASRGLLKAFAEDVELIRIAAYAYRQHALWSKAVGQVAEAVRRWDRNSDVSPLLCYCDECESIPGFLSGIRCRCREILLYCYSPYKLKTPGLER